MVRSPTGLGSLRFSRLEKERLLVALLVSLLAHLVVWGGYEAGKKTGLWEKWHLFKHQTSLAQLKKPVDTARPTVFVEVAEAAPEAPKQAKYYSDKNSRAANPTADKNSNVPKLTGTQKEVPKTENVPRPVKAKPTPPTPPAQPKSAEKPKPKETDLVRIPKPGDLEKAHQPDTLKPSPKPKRPEKPERPRTLRQALAMEKNRIPGMEMRQEGGVRRHNLTSSLDALSTSFGGYDRAVIEAISQRWYDLLDQQQFAMDRTGKVTIHFRLNPDGSVTEANIAANTVGDVLGYLCLESIEQSAPFGKWPSDMRLKFGAYREITFTFYYY